MFIYHTNIGGLSENIVNVMTETSVMSDKNASDIIKSETMLNSLSYKIDSFAEHIVKISNLFNETIILLQNLYHP